MTHTTTETADRLDRLRLLDTLLRNNTGLIQLADRKAQTLLRLVLALFMVAFIGVPPAVAALRRFATDGDWKTVLFVGVVALYTLCAACLLGSVVQIIGALRPRVDLRDDTRSDLFYARIASMEPADVQSMLARISHEEVCENLGKEIYNTAVIADHKYRRLNAAITWMLSGGLFGIVFALILLISFGLGSE